MKPVSKGSVLDNFNCLRTLPSVRRNENMRRKLKKTTSCTMSKLSLGHNFNRSKLPLKTLFSLYEPALSSASDKTPFNAAIKAKIFSDDFKIARATPIFENGETDNLGNYRPISILGSIARVFEKITLQTTT